MSHADLDVRRAYNRVYYLQNRGRIRAEHKERYDTCGGKEYSRNRARAQRAWLRTLKEGKPCEDCGLTFPHFVLDWHHRNPLDKEFEIANGGLSKGRQTILSEIAKCSLLCANCHRVREYSKED